MDLWFTLGISFGGLVLTIGLGGFVGYPLLLAITLCSLCYLRRGVSLWQLLQQMAASVRRAASVIGILLLIGGVVALWMAAGTVPSLVYYGLGLINPNLFILSAFLLTAAIAVLIGTSFGAVGTVGIALMVMARSGEVNLDWVTGAIIAGAYVGDRWSPLSSSAHLVATLTQTNIYQNLQLMLRTTWLPLTMTCSIYWGMSLSHPLKATDNSLAAAIPEVFNLHPVTLIPAIAVLVLACSRLKVSYTLLVSLGLAAIIAVSLQKLDGSTLLKTLVLGYQLEDGSPLQTILKGGGLLSMARVCLVVTLSMALAGLLIGPQILNRFEQPLQRFYQSNCPIFWGTTGVGLGAAIVGCTQTLAILLTQKLTHTLYIEANLAPQRQALDLEDTAVVIAPLIPWNIAGLVPAAILGSDAGFIPYAVYLYLLPLVGLFTHRPVLPTIPNPDAVPSVKP